LVNKQQWLGIYTETLEWEQTNVYKEELSTNLTNQSIGNELCLLRLTITWPINLKESWRLFSMFTKKSITNDITKMLINLFGTLYDMVFDKYLFQ
jgi:hypothetical protein